VLLAADRVYADARTPDVYEAWMAGGADVVRILTESTLETQALRKKYDIPPRC
jgi:hypothetical protein